MRQIIEEDGFTDAVIELGGHRIVDLALSSVMKALMQNPHGFKLQENQFTSFRYAITREVSWPGKEVPALIVVFTISDNGDVHLQHVERYEP